MSEDIKTTNKLCITSALLSSFNKWYSGALH